MDEAILNLDPIPETSPIPSNSNSSESSWDKDRQYGIVIDAGSSGSRVLVYSWKDVTIQRKDGAVGLPIIDKADEKGQTWHKNIEPGNNSIRIHMSFSMVLTIC
jgi:hypothetical protein